MQKEALKEILVSNNPWWISGGIGNLPQKKREVFHYLVPKLSSDRILGIIGPRRIGKTTIMYQLIEHLIKSKVDPKDILFLSLDNPLFTEEKAIIKEAISIFKELVVSKSPKYIFFDEVQYIKDWSRYIKVLYDQMKNFHFMISGSSSALIYKQTSESLVGRIEFVRLSILSFYEYCYFVNKEEHRLVKSIEKLRGHSQLLFQKPVDYYKDIYKLPDFFYLKERISPIFQDYIFRGGVTGIMGVEWPQAKKWLREDYLGLVLYRDILKMFEVRNPKSLEELIYLLVELHAHRLNYAKISNALGLRMETVKEYLSYLESVGLVHIIYYYSRSIKQRMRSEKKIYIFDSGLKNAAKDIGDKLDLHARDMGCLVEGVIASRLINRFSHLFNTFVSYWSEKGRLYEVDFIVSPPDFTRPIPIEVKYQSTVSVKDIKSLLKFCDRFKMKKAIVINRDELAIKGEMLFCPAWLFLLNKL